MTHAWLFTGPPGSGRSVAARAFAAALQCPRRRLRRVPAHCRTVMAGTHADVHEVVPEGLSHRRQGDARRGRSGPRRGPTHGAVAGRADRGRRPADRAGARTRCSRPWRSRRRAPCSCSARRAQHPDDVTRDHPVALPAGAAAHPAGRRDRRGARRARRRRRRDRELGGQRGRRARRPGPAAGPRRGRPEPARGGARRAAVLAEPRRRCSTAADGLVGAAEAEVDAADRGARRGRDARSWRSPWAPADRARASRPGPAGGEGGGEGPRAPSRSSAPPARAATRWTAPWSTSPASTATCSCAGSAPRSPRPTRTAPARSRRRPGTARPRPRCAASRRCSACREALETNVKPQIAVEAMVTALRAG